MITFDEVLAQKKREIDISFHLDFLVNGWRKILDDRVQSAIFNAMDNNGVMGPFVVIKTPDATFDDETYWLVTKYFYYADPQNKLDPIAPRLYELMIELPFYYNGTKYYLRGDYGIGFDYEDLPHRLVWGKRMFVLLEGEQTSILESFNPWEKCQSILIK